MGIDLDRNGSLGISVWSYWIGDLVLVLADGFSGNFLVT